MNLITLVKQLLHIPLTDKELTLKNLRILSKHWKKQRDKVNLVMHTFGGIDKLTITKFLLTGKKTHKCGDKCCLLGLAPEVLEIDAEKHFKGGVFDYMQFSLSHFPYLHSDACFNDLGIYVFSELWPDDLDHALNRIKTVVKGGTPENMYSVLNTSIFTQQDYRFRIIVQHDDVLSRYLAKPEKFHD